MDRNLVQMNTDGKRDTEVQSVQPERKGFLKKSIIISYDETIWIIFALLTTLFQMRCNIRYTPISMSPKADTTGINLYFVTIVVFSL